MTPANRRLVIIHNPTSGMRNKSRFSKALLRLAETRCEVEILKTSGPGHATFLTQELISRNEPDLVLVAAGGDGTVSEILNGLTGGALPLGVIPLGTANVLARELGIGVSIDKAVETLVHADPVPAYTAVANDKRFLLMLGAGYDSLAVAALNSNQKKRFGAIAYVVAAVRAISGFQDMKLDIKINGTHYSAGTVVISKAKYYGGPFIIAPDGGLDKPRLDVLIFKGSGIVNALRYGVALLLNRISRLPDVETLVTDMPILLTASREFPCQCDGDGGLVTPVKVSLDPKPLMILRAAV
ncbi:YegS/Rv2252/BmrU family lipid kinase [Sneathiella sp. CAU 1612]|uniref:YegS/Rv2252/BmrU family lipid kinase n=1 Tax=Sneathiella sedimenti TaxID=2816034 RepID=A0ABS3F5Q1_9PROT|nr:YegS/Rv2252/BmrU family lipid kinase [Sneathiella sedimenti]MBO0333846.1 YegS/Rv2252/BmrU family lipid kinase [Sneathiella sedimenti]